MTETLWDETVAQLRSSLPVQDFTAWIACLTSTVRGDALTVQAPNVFHRNWVRTHFLDRIRSTATRVAGRPVAISLAVGSDCVVPSPRLARPAPVPTIRTSPSPGHGAFTFETFVIGSCNQLAHAGAVAVSEQPGVTYNPLFIHGGVGLGKTHLVHATANAIRRRFGSYRVLAISAELFINEMVSSVRRQQMESFHQRFRKIDTLVVDDVQFIGGKERTQEEFLHTFNLLCAAGKQIVLSSDKPPREIPNLEVGLRSRFEGGLTVEVTRPDRDTRRRIFARKAVQQGLELSEEVLERLTDRVRAVSVREIEGALTRLKALASLVSRPIDVALVEETIGPFYPVTRERVSVERVEALVAEALDLPVGTLVSGRTARLVFARQVSMYLLKKEIGLSFAAIGERYGRDHTTVMHAVRAIEARRACDPEVRRLVAALEERL